MLLVLVVGSGYNNDNLKQKYSNGSNNDKKNNHDNDISTIFVLDTIVFLCLLLSLDLKNENLIVIRSRNVLKKQQIILNPIRFCPPLSRLFSPTHKSRK
jgi:hypothetical protein